MTLVPFASLALLASLLPPGALPEGWARAEEPKSFVGPALYDHIDGGAELFLELGFEAVSIERYRRGEDGILVEDYRMTDPAAALGIYLAKCGRETPAPGFSERHTAGRWQVALVKGRDYILVTSDKGSENVAPLLVEAAKRVAEGIAATPPVAVLSLLPPEGLVAGSVRIVRGPFGLQSIATLGAGDVLLFGGKVTAVAGDYRDADGATITRLVAEYPDPERAAEALKHVRAGLDPLLTAVESGDARLVFKDASGKFGFVARDGRRVEIRLDLREKPGP